jgi:Sulfotransferase family
MGLRQHALKALHDLPPGVHEAVPPSLRRSLRHHLDRYYAWEYGYDHHRTPQLAPGEENGPPGFVGIGVQKAGTSWWYKLIVRHPHVSDPPIHKERHFFARFGAEQFGPTDIADYRAWFPRRQGTTAGEWTPDYFFYPWVPSLLAEAAPDTKLLLILRDPVQRFRSGLAHQIRNGEDHVGSAQAEAVGRSLYSDALRRWQQYFPPEQLLVLQYEVCVANPIQQLVSTYEYLGLDPSYRPEDLRDEVNKTVERKAGLPEDALHRLRELFAPDIRALATMVPTLDLSLWPSADGLLD